MKRPYYHLFVTGVVLFIVAIVARTILIQGYIHFRDVTEGIDISRLYERYIYTYSNDIGESLAEKARIPLFFLILGIYKVFSFLGFGDEFYVKIKIFLLFITTFFSFLFTTRKLIEKYLPLSQNHSKNSPAMLIPPVLGALFYTTNFWFTNRIAHFGLFYATVTVPIVFWLLFDYFFSEKKDLRKLILLSLLLGVLTATPHTVLLEIIIFISVFVGYLIARNGTKDKLITPLWHLLVFTFTTIIVNVYWILPYLISNSKPDAEVSETIVNLIGKYATLQNSLGLMGYWLTEPENYFPGNHLYAVAFIPLLLFAFAFVGLKVKKQHGLFLSLLIMFILGAFLSTSEPITDLFYFKLMFNSPLKNFGWLFREYDKIGLILTFVYSLGISVLFRFTIRKTRLFLMAIFPFCTIILINLIFLNKTLERDYQPIPIPESYRKVVSIISKDSADANVLWYPGNPKPFWANGEEVRFTFTNLISPKPSITTRSELINYANYIFNLENVYSIDIGRALDLVGVKYLVIRKDDSVFKSGKVEDLLNTQTSISKLYSDELLTLYENTEFTGLGRVYDSKIETNMGLKFFKQEEAGKYQNSNTYIDFTDKPSYLSTNNKYYLSDPYDPLDNNLSKFSNKFVYPAPFSHKKEDGNPGYWKTGSLENVNHAEVDFFLNSLGLNIRQFDYGKGIIMARDGWQMEENIFSKGKAVGIMFSGHQNVTLANNYLRYSSIPSDFQYYWNTIKSDRFDVLGKTALGIRFDSEIPENLIPHYKFTFYGPGDVILGITQMYQDKRGLMENIVKVPANAETAVFSIWTISKEIDQKYSYTLSDFAISDLSEMAKPINMTFTTNLGCIGTCEAYIRSLKSNIGGRLRVIVSGKEFYVDTKTPGLERSDRYEWNYLGKVENIGQNAKITLENLDGFNSINALVFLDNNENESVYTNVPDQYENTAENSPLKESPTIQIKQINPTKYELRILNNLEGKSVIALAKPYSKNWILEPGNKEANIVNGYTNGWEIENLREGTYTVEYKPQIYFLKGAFISGVAAGILGLILLISYFRTFSASERKSNSQG